MGGALRKFGLAMLSNWIIMLGHSTMNFTFAASLVLTALGAGYPYEYRRVQRNEQTTTKQEDL